MRTKGSTANVKVTLKTLLENHPLGENAVVEVRRKWLEGVESLANVKFDIADNTRKVEASPPNAKEVTDQIDKKDELVPKVENILQSEEL